MLDKFLPIFKNLANTEIYGDHRGEFLTAAEITFLEEALNPNKIKKAPLRDLMTAFGKVAEANRDNGNSNNSVHNHLHFHISEIEDDSNS